MKHLILTTSTLALLQLVALPVMAQTNYDFDESCAPTTLHAAEQGVPDALVILDRSGSMDDFGGYDAGGNSRSKLWIAKSAIRELTEASSNSGTCTMSDRTGCDDVRVGLGWFSSSSGVDVLPAEDTKTAVFDTVNSYNTNGGTATGRGARRIYESTELRNAERVGLGIMITDGSPAYDGDSGTRRTVEETFHYLCAARNDHAILTFMIGFGSGANPRTNAAFAAAGGTGTCCLSSDPSTPCTYQPNELIDPCLLPRRDATRLNVESTNFMVGSKRRHLNPYVECKGAKQANNGQELKDDLLELIDQIACTFPLDIPNDYLRFPGADEDPGATRVEFDHAVLGNNIRVTPLDPGNPNAFRDYLVNQRGIATSVADQYIGEGWSFGDPLRRTVVLTDKLCEEVRSDNVELTETQVACLCENTGSDCNVLCEDGDNDGYDDTTGAACEDDGQGTDIQAGRCGPGIVECIVGVEYCASKYSMQPDICNGVDDDCDGNVDNSSRANSSYNDMDPDDTPGTDAFEWNGNMTQLTDAGLSEGLFCGFRDFSCSCNTEGAHEIGYVPDANNPDADHEWKEMLRATADQIDRCVCNAGLEPEASPLEQTPAEEEPLEESDAAACSSAPGTPASPGALMLFIGLFAAAFRRKRS